jgi:hypothetical protein
MTPRRPEIRNRRTYRRIVLMRITIYISCIRDLALRSGINTMDLGAGQGFQGW